jgi:hypothetical protein
LQPSASPKGKKGRKEPACETDEGNDGKDSEGEVYKGDMRRKALLLVGCIMRRRQGQRL